MFVSEKHAQQRFLRLQHKGAVWLQKPNNHTTQRLPHLAQREKRRHAMHGVLQALTSGRGDSTTSKDNPPRMFHKNQKVSGYRETTLQIPMGERRRPRRRRWRDVG
jgi:hypothetical protein